MFARVLRQLAGDARDLCRRELRSHDGAPLVRCGALALQSCDVALYLLGSAALITSPCAQDTHPREAN
jgi:hypothetical protein